MKDYGKYFIKVFLLTFLIFPLLLNLVAIIFVLVTSFIGNIIFPLICASGILILFLLLGKKFLSKSDFPEKFLFRQLPVILGLGGQIFFWNILLIVSKYEYSSTIFATGIWIAFSQHFIAIFATSFVGIYQYLLYYIIFLFVISLLGVEFFIYREKKERQGADGPRRVFLIFGVIIIFIGMSAANLYNKEFYILSHDYSVETVSDEIDFFLYQPFVEDNLLIKIAEEPTLIIADNYPRLDGATAAFPVYGAIAEGLYQGLDEDSIREYVQCNTTPFAYERLIKGETDLIFGAQPSKEQLELAEKNGVTLTLTPIAKEAFVFFVNQNNSVDSLTVEEIQNIYLKDITNWRSFAGKNQKIIPFQRPSNSGSQTIMEAKVMQGLILPEPLQEEYTAGMGEIIKEVAEYRNYDGAIGYSFRYYATEMNPNANVKLLAIGGIEPTPENIRNGSYPFTVDIYAVSANSDNENLPLLIDWLKSEQGQRYVNESGYVGYY